MKKIIVVFVMLFFSSMMPSVFASCIAPISIGDEFQNYAEANTVFIGMVRDIYNPQLKEHLGKQQYDTVTATASIT